MDWVSWTPSGQIGDTIKLFDDTAWPPQKAHGLARNLWLVSPLQWNVLAVDLANAGAAAPAGGAPSGKNVPARHAGHYCCDLGGKLKKWVRKENFQVEIENIIQIILKTN